MTYRKMLVPCSVDAPHHITSQKLFFYCAKYAVMMPPPLRDCARIPAKASRQAY